MSAEIATNETLRKELAPPGGWVPAVRLVVPEIDVHDAMTVDPALIAIAFDYGWLRAADTLLGLGPDEAPAPPLPPSLPPGSTRPDAPPTVRGGSGGGQAGRITSATAPTRSASAISVATLTAFTTAVADDDPWLMMQTPLRPRSIAPPVLSGSSWP